MTNDERAMLNPTAYPKVNAVLDEYLAALEREFGAELVAVYLLGSLSTGSYVLGWSDINGVMIAQPDDITQLEARLQNVTQNFNTPPFTCLVPRAALEKAHWQTYNDRWGLINQTNLVEDGILIWGQELRDALERPNLEELRAYQIEQIIQLLEAAPGKKATAWQKSEWRGLPVREPRSEEWNYYRQHPTEIVDWLIYPARILLTWDKGRIGSKTEAVNHYIEEYHGPWEPILLQADTLRRAGAIELLTPETLTLFSRQTPGLFEWVVRRLLTILFLPNEWAEAARNLRRWLARDPTLPRPRPGETFEILIPNRKPWLRES